MNCSPNEVESVNDELLNVDRILQTLNAFKVKFMLIGGMNYAIRHAPYVTNDIDLWIEDTDANRAACEAALAALDSEWGKHDDDWGPVSKKDAGWLVRQGVFSLYSPHGAIDIFRNVAGLNNWEQCFARAVAEQTKLGTNYFGLSDADMLQCQLALEVPLRRIDRIETLQKSLKQNGDDQ